MTQPPPYGQPGYGPQPQPGYGPQPQPGYGPQPQPGYGPSPAGYGPQPQPGLWPPQPQPGYGPQPQPGHGSQQRPYGYAAQPPPGYAQPQGYAPPPPPKSKPPMALIVGAIVLAVLVVGGLAAVLLLRSGDGGGSPTAAFDGLFTAALKDRDNEKAKSYVCEAEVANLGDITGLGPLEQNPAEVDVTWQNISEVSQTGDEAVVSVDMVLKMKMGDQETNQTMTMKVKVVKEGGGWKVCGGATAG